MPAHIDMTASLARELSLLARAVHPELMIGCRVIEIGDETALTPAEAEPLASSILSIRRASGAARIVAKSLLSELSAVCSDLPKLPSGAPAWPLGFVGSLTHDSPVAVAAVATSQALTSIGIDVEPNEPLPGEILDRVALPAEKKELDGDLVAARLLFCAKEAVYKATNPIDGVFLEHHDVEVCRSSSIARTASGHSLRVYTIEHPRLFALAVLQSASST